MDHRVTVLEILRTRSPASRGELAMQAGLSAATVSRAVERLREDGLVREIAGTPAGIGRPPRLVELRPEAAFVVGIDAGGTMLRAALADIEGVVRARAVRPVSDPRDGTAIIDDLVGLVREVTVHASGRPTLAASAGISGIVDHATGAVRLSPDLPGLDGLNLAASLREALGLPVVVDNDDLLAAIGEAAVGAARGCADVAFLSLGHGLGAGLIVGGRPVRGASSAAGAIAYLAPGRLEDRASGRAIPARYHAAMVAAEMAAGENGTGAPPEGSRLGPTALRGPAVGGEPPVEHRRAGEDRLDARGVFERAAAGDPIAAAVVADAVDAIGDLVVDVAALLDPDVIVLGGGLTSAGNVLFEPLQRRLAGTLPYPPRLVASALEGAAVVHGAVSVALAAAKHRLATPDGPARATPEPGRMGVLELV